MSWTATMALAGELITHASDASGKSNRRDGWLPCAQSARDRGVQLVRGGTGQPDAVAAEPPRLPLGAAHLDCVIEANRVGIAPGQAQRFERATGIHGEHPWSLAVSGWPAHVHLLPGRVLTRIPAVNAQAEGHG